MSAVFPIARDGRLRRTLGDWKFWLENEMVHTIPFETFQHYGLPA